MFNNLFGRGTSTETLTTGLCIPPNTFAHSVLDELEDGGFDELAVDLPVRAHADINLGGNPLDAAQLARTSRTDWSEGEANAYIDLAALVHVSTLGGTGYLAHRFAGMPDTVDSSMDVLEVLVGSDDVAQRRSPQETVAQALAYPFINRGCILLSNRSYTESRQRISQQVGRLITTLAREDIADLQHYCYTGHYRRIETGGKRRTKTDFARILRETIHSDAWFDPSDWLWWTPVEDPGPALGDDAIAFAVVPEGYEEVRLSGTDSAQLHTVTADVDDIHVVVLRRLRRPWVEELRTGGIRWLRQSIDRGTDKYGELWASYVDNHGGGEPTMRFEAFLDENYGAVSDVIDAALVADERSDTARSHVGRADGGTVEDSPGDTEN